MIIILNDVGKYTYYFIYLQFLFKVFVPFVDTKSKASKRRRFTTDLELSLSSFIVENSDGWFRNSGIAYEMNDYAADGSLFDYVAGVRNIPISICAEMWGGPYHEACFVQFNPPSSRLAKDLQEMHKFFVSAFEGLFQLHMGIRQIHSTHSALDSADSVSTFLCELQQKFQKF